MKKIAIALAFVGAVSLPAEAQKGIDSNTRYGIGQDSVRCIENLSLYVPYAKSGNFKDAYDFWNIVYQECPLANKDIYVWGVKIVAWQMSQEKDATKRGELFNKMMEIYDKRIQYFGDDVRYPKAYILGLKAADYIQNSPESDKLKKSAYQWLEESIDVLGADVSPVTVQYFMQLSVNIFLNEDTHKEKLINDYLKAGKATDGAIAQGGKDKDVFVQVKGVVDQMFANSGAADCATLESVFAPQVEANKDNLPWLKETLGLMRRANCRENDSYFAASAYAHAIEPSSESAAGMAQQAIKKGDNDTAVKYLEEAINFEEDAQRKAEYYFYMAQILADQNSYSQARSAAYKAAETNPNYGAPYLLVATLYAKTARSIYPEDPVMQSAVYYLVVDKCARAKSVDSSVTESANKMIGQYSGYFPKAQDVFMHKDLEKGKSVYIGGWIGESTTAR